MVHITQLCQHRNSKSQINQGVLCRGLKFFGKLEIHSPVVSTQKLQGADQPGSPLPRAETLWHAMAEIWDVRLQAGFEASGLDLRPQGWICGSSAGFQAPGLDFKFDAGSEAPALDVKLQGGI